MQGHGWVWWEGELQVVWCGEGERLTPVAGVQGPNGPPEAPPAGAAYGRAGLAPS